MSPQETQKPSSRALPFKLCLIGLAVVVGLACLSALAGCAGAGADSNAEPMLFQVVLGDNTGHMDQRAVAKSSAKARSTAKPHVEKEKKSYSPANRSKLDHLVTASTKS